MNAVETIWLEIKRQLEQQKQQVNDEIFHYPPPIPACDAQFNYLLEERVHLTQALQQVRELAAKEAVNSDSIKALVEFVQLCPYIDKVRMAQLMTDLKAV